LKGCGFGLRGITCLRLHLVEEKAWACPANSRKSQCERGILGYRRGPRGFEVLLVHPGGPFWRNMDEGAWSNTERRDRRFGRREGPSRICRRARPRNHDRLARRSGRGPAARGKRVIAFYGEVDFDATTLSSNTSRSSGRSGAVGASPFRRWTALNGPIWKLRGRGFCPARLSSLIGSPQRHGALLTIVSIAVRSTGDAEGFKTIAIILAHAGPR